MQHLYVLELEGGNYYVGITTDVERRYAEHAAGGGAVWTTLHKPIRMLSHTSLGDIEVRYAERIESLKTVELMRQYGVDHVRGGFYCNIEREVVEMALRAHGHYLDIQAERLKRKTSGGGIDIADARDDVLCRLKLYRDSQYSSIGADGVLDALFSLAHQPQAGDLSAAFEWEFWGRRGLVYPILHFADAAKSQIPGEAYATLHGALSRSFQTAQPHQLTFMLAWRAFAPPLTANQTKKVGSLFAGIVARAKAGYAYDPTYHAALSILFPQTRREFDRVASYASMMLAHELAPRRPARASVGQPKSLGAWQA